MNRKLAGSRIGRWTVLERVNRPGPAVWLCVCDCGTRREVAAKNLVTERSVSCGCLKTQRTIETKRIDLSGRRFGNLTVIGRAEKAENGAERWNCRCECGAECVVLHTLLQSGKRTGCGKTDCRYARAGAKPHDAAGMRSGMLTAIEPTEKRDSHGSVIWRCRCDCGKETEIAAYRLKSGAVKSCGCMRGRQSAQKPSKADNPAKVRSDSTTGITGVRCKDGKYEAYISFGKKRHYLGTFDELRTAADVRRKAERLVAGEPAEAPYRRRKRPIITGVPDDASGVIFDVAMLPDGEYTVSLMAVAGS